MTGRKTGPRGPYHKPPVRVPAPQWAPPGSPPFVLVSQEHATAISTRSADMVSRWAHGRAAIDPQSLLLLQLHAFGAVVPPAWLARGIFFAGDVLVTHAGVSLELGELHSYAWLRDRYHEGLRELEAREAAQKAASAPPVPLAEVIPLQALRDARSARVRAPETKNPA